MRHPSNTTECVGSQNYRFMCCWTRLALIYRFHSDDTVLFRKITPGCKTEGESLHNQKKMESSFLTTNLKVQKWSLGVQMEVLVRIVQLSNKTKIQNF